MTSDDISTAFASAHFWGREPTGGFPKTFAIITAFNPHGRLQEEFANRQADEALLLELRKLGPAHFRIYGGSSDRGHVEPGWGFPPPAPEIPRMLSKRFLQLAYFYIEDGAIDLMSTDTGTCLSIGRWIDRWSIE